MPDYVWVDDPDAALSADPYSAWLLGHGKAFDVTQEEVKEDPADFAYRARVNAYNNVIIEPQVQTGPHSGLIYPAPLRKRSVAAAGVNLNSPRWASPAGLDKDKVVAVAVIDDGLNFANQRFRLGSDRSRVDFAWVQDGTNPASADATERTTVGFGREWTRDDIDQALGQYGDDETALLRHLELARFDRLRAFPAGRRVSHGTHVMDLAGGRDSSDTNGVNCRLIAVQLPHLATEDISGALLTPFFVAALDYVLQRVRTMSRFLGVNIPVVVNFSYGFAGGGHNGGHAIERAMSALVDFHKKHKHGAAVEIVLPTGNSRATRSHARTAETNSVGEAAELTVPWRV